MPPVTVSRISMSGWSVVNLLIRQISQREAKTLPTVRLSTLSSLPLHAGQPVLQRRKPAGQLRQRLPQRRRSAPGHAGALEQFHAQPLLGPAQMLADRADGHAQFLGRRGQRTAPCDNFDGAQRIQRNGKGIGHIDFL